MLGLDRARARARVRVRVRVMFRVRAGAKVRASVSVRLGVGLGLKLGLWLGLALGLRLMLGLGLWLGPGLRQAVPPASVSSSYYSSPICPSSDANPQSFSYSLCSGVCMSVGICAHSLEARGTLHAKSEGWL